MIQLGTVFLLFKGIFWDSILSQTRTSEMLTGAESAGQFDRLLPAVLMHDEAPNATRLAWVLGESRTAHTCMGCL